MKTTEYSTSELRMANQCGECRPGGGDSGERGNEEQNNHGKVTKHYLFTYSMVQNIIWKAEFSLSKNVLLSLWNPKVHHRVHKGPPLDPILSQPNPVRPMDPYLPKVHLNVILPPTSRSSQWSLTFGPLNQNPVNTSPLPHVCYMSRPPHPPSFNHPNNIRWRIQVTKFIIMQFSPWSVFLPFRSKYPSSTLCPQKPSVCVPPS
jgi:hypothetical protein